MLDPALDGLLIDVEAHRWLLGVLLAAMLVCGVVLMGELAPDPLPLVAVDEREAR